MFPTHGTDVEQERVGAQLRTSPLDWDHPAGPSHTSSRSLERSLAEAGGGASAL